MHWLGEIIFQLVFEIVTWPFRRWMDRKFEGKRKPRRRADGTRR